ncbi:MAG: hypothetical protein Q8R18_01940 [bacterium]|nr:hypothetical protein [bacterium]
MNQFRGALFLLIVVIISTIVFGADPPAEEDLYGVEEKGSGEDNIIPTATTDTAPGGYTFTDANAEEETPAQFTVSEDAPITKFDNIPAGTEVHTEYGDFTGADFSNAVFGNGGIYEATITGISAGATFYFLSSFDDQLFSLTAGTDESEVRVIQFQKNGSLLDRIYMELAEGDQISQGALLEPMMYHFQAYDNDAVYIYNEDQSTEITLGEHSYNGSYYESFENPTDEEIKTQLTQEGFEEITLPENASYTYKALGILDDINVTLSNSARQSISICKLEREGCQAYNKITSFIIEEKDLQLKQNGYTIVESYDANNIIELNFAEQTAYLTNINPEEEILALFRVGYHEITETNDTIYSNILTEEYPYLFTLYDSDKVIPELKIENKVLKYQDQNNAAYSLPNIDAMEIACFRYAYQKTRSNTNDPKTEYCL